jgi:hypothetical protein
LQGEVECEEEKLRVAIDGSPPHKLGVPGASPEKEKPRQPRKRMSIINLKTKIKRTIRKIN